MEKRRYPRKGAGRKWAAILKELGQKPPPKDLVERINRQGERKEEKAAVAHQDSEAE